MTARNTVTSKLTYDKERRTIVKVVRDLTVCGSCKEPVSKDWTYCPYCGAQERADAAKPKRKE